MVFRDLVGSFVTGISSILGILVWLLAVLYLFYAVDILSDMTKEQRKICDSEGIVASTIKNDVYVKKWCENWKHEIAAGALGFLFGLIQAVVSLVVFCGQNNIWKSWLLVHIFVLIATLTVSSLVFKVYKYYEQEGFMMKLAIVLTNLGIISGFHHNGNPPNADIGNRIVVAFASVSAIDAIFIFGAIILVVMCTLRS